MSAQHSVIALYDKLYNMSPVNHPMEATTNFLLPRRSVQRLPLLVIGGDWRACRLSGTIRICFRVSEVSGSHREPDRAVSYYTQ
jgi:hypothetical protein